MHTNNETKSSQLLEKLAIGIFVIGGCGGYFCTMSSMTYVPKEPINNSFYLDSSVQNNHTKSSSIDLDGNLLEQGPSVKSLKASSKRAYQQELYIKGHMEAQSPVVFTIEEFTPKANYYLDFGDGIIRELNQKSNAHVYAKPGNYEVKLSLRYKGQEAVLNTKNITIYPPIMVSMNATKVDF